MKARLSEIDSEAEKWLKAKYPFQVDTAKGTPRKGVRSEWKSFQSTMTFNEPLLIGDEVRFSFYKRAGNDKGEVFVFFLAKGKTQSGLKIGNNLSIGYPDGDAPNRGKMTDVPASTFKIKPDS